MLTPKENYLMMLRGEVPAYLPSIYEPPTETPPAEPFTTPISAPNGPIHSAWGVKFIGSVDNNFGAIPEPSHYILTDIRKWRDVIRNPDLSGVDWEAHITRPLADKDRKNKVLYFGGGDYFQTLVSFMGFTEALIAMVEEPEEVYALLDYISQHYLAVMKQQLYYGRPEVYLIADDCAAAHAPFFSPDMYRALIKPFHKRHADLALDAGVLLEKHDCGRSEVFIDDWLELGIRGWNPAQTTNDLAGVKRKYGGRLAICGGWDNQGPVSMPDTPDEALLEALRQYVDLLAPGGGFMFMAMVTGARTDPRVKRKEALIRDFFFDYARDYYQTH